MIIVLQSRRNPELAARHAAAAARHAAAAARHANAAAKFAGLKLRTSPKGGHRRRSHAGNGPLCESPVPPLHGMPYCIQLTFCHARHVLGYRELGAIWLGLL